MAIKVALLVIVAVGFSSYILLAETATEFSCNVNGVYSVVIGNVTFDLIGCMTNYGELCLRGVPPTCSGLHVSLPQCYQYTWHTGVFEWSVVICKYSRPRPGYCYRRVLQRSCYEILGDHTTSVEAKQNSDCVCIENAQTEAKKVCIPENCDVIGGSQTKRWP